QVLQSFANFALEVFGEFAPYDKFKIEKPETFIGRDPEKCEIVLNDPEVSGVHAVIKKNAITCTLEDLKSANGTILNGERINSHELTSEDEFLIGSTSFTVKIQSDFIEQEKDRIMPVEANQIVEVEEVVEVDENFVDEDGSVIEGDELGGGTLDTKPKSLFSKESLKDPQQRKKILYILVGLLALWVVMDEEVEEKPVKVPEKKTAAKKEDKKPTKANQKPLTPEEKEYVESQYLLAKQYFSESKYAETIQELDKIFAITPDYKNARQIKNLAKEGLEAIAKLLEEERKEKERKLREQKVKELVAKAKVAVKENQVQLAESLFQEILKLDPENFDVTQLKLQVDAYKKEQERIALEKAQKEAERKRQLQELSPGKNYFLTKDYYKAILKLQSFLRQENIDEDLIKEASGMLDQSKQNLNSVVNPLIGKARSMKEGQDLKGAYELYLEVLKFHPAHEEALNEMDEIRDKLELRSKRVYREAIIAESLSLYNDAKEKFQEVQQISPTDSEYYEKATDKLKDYLD
ncbi:MAG: FHA domain-containing protein, partial [Halobacteriovoraceae bacterium]|nr:FHA domain-containing protein [Halobacteriovoraceae bacterium]